MSTRADECSGNVRGMFADIRHAVDLCHPPGQVRVGRVHGAAIPLTQAESTAIEIEAGGTAGPDLVRGDGVRLAG